jgi:hypothetical protein
MRLSLFFLSLVVLFLYSCSPPTPLQPAQDFEPGFPLNTKTGIAQVDNVLAAMASRDPRKLQGLVRYTTAPCTMADGLGGPPKYREGEAEGTLLQVLPYLASEGGHIRRSEMSDWQGIQADSLYAVYRVSENALDEQYYPPGEYLVIFMPDDHGDYPALRIADGGIVRVDTILGSDSLKTFIERDTAEVILPPETR